MGYVETLFGHQDRISDVDALRGETAITSGSRDKTVRYWKIADETQIVFRGGAKSLLREMLEGGDVHDGEEGGKSSKKGKQNFVEGSMECVAMLDETTFLSGGDSG
jgi:ribosomal RNA-processing protein 9